MNITVNALTLIANGTPSEKGHVTVARFDAQIPGVQIRGCSLMISGTTGKPYWSASSPRRYSSAYVNDKALYHAVLDAALAAYSSLGGRLPSPAGAMTTTPLEITRICGSSATGAWGGQ